MFCCFVEIMLNFLVFYFLMYLKHLVLTTKVIEMSVIFFQKFESEATLAVHKQKHQMTLTLGPSKLTSLADVLPVGM